MYFGSVRFFKNLILLAVCIAILLPSVLAYKYHRGLVDTQAAAVTASHTAEAAKAELQRLENEQAEAAARAEAEPASEPVSADPPSYQALFPDFYAPEPYGAVERVENVIYLTFDDGPSERTDEILDVLAEKDVKATFFVIGQDDEENLQRMRRIVAEGHTIGMHSYSHDYPTVYASIEGFLEEFYKNFTQIREATGVTPTAFRFPGGSINGYDGAFYQELIGEMIRRGFVPYDWNISSEDAVGARSSADTLADNVVRGASGKVRGFVLFHDSETKTTTPEALGMVIDRLRDMGYSFAPISPSTLPVLYNYET